MLERFLFAVLAVSVCSTGVFAQADISEETMTQTPDIFVTFGANFAFTPDGAFAPEGAFTPGNGVGAAVADGVGAGSNMAFIDQTTTSGTGFIFVRSGIEFDVFEVDLISSNNAVAQITSATTINSSFFFSGTRFNSELDLNANGILDDGETGDINSIPGFIDASGVATFQGVSINQRGLSDPGFAVFDSGFDVDADAFLLATFDFDIVGVGSTTFALQTTDSDIIAGPTGFITIPELGVVDAEFGDATLTVTNVAAVPEPSSAVLLALGWVGLAARRRR